MKVISFGNTLGIYTFPLYEHEEDYELRVKPGLVNLPGGDGAFDALGREVLAMPLLLRKRFEIIASSYAGVDTEIDDLLKILAANEGLLKAQMRDDSYRVIWAKVKGLGYSYRATEREKTFIHMPVTVDFEGSYRHWEAGADIWYLDSGLLLDDGHSFDENYTQRMVTTSPDTFSINNTGTAPIKRGMIEIDGQCTNPKVTNLTNGFWFQWTGTLESDWKLLIDLGAMSVLTYNPLRTNAWANVTLGADQVELMRLDIGSNSLKFEATSPNCKLTWWWAKAYQ